MGKGIKKALYRYGIRGQGRTARHNKYQKQFAVGSRKASATSIKTGVTRAEEIFIASKTQLVNEMWMRDLTHSWRIKRGAATCPWKEFL